MKLHLKLIAIALAGLAVACSKDEAIVAAEPTCFFQDGNGPYDTPAPEWVCTERFGDVALSSVASFRQTSAGYDFMTDMATARARQRIAAVISSKALASAKDYRETTGNDLDSETSIAVASLTQKTLTEALLVGSSVLNKTRNPKTGQVYVIVGVTPERLSDLVDDAAENAFASDRAEFQRFKASQSFEELKADLQSN